jgi:hypothetical protein
VLEAPAAEAEAVLSAAGFAGPSHAPQHASDPR